MTPEIFDFFATFFKERSGLHLQKEKQYLLESRLSSVMLKHNMDDYDALCRAVKRGGDLTLINDVVESMSVTETSFFRDSKPFQLFLKRALPEILNNRPKGRPIRIWSAAASSGQEAYTLAILCRENADLLADHRVEIMATDISNQVLEKARAGVYSQFEVQRGMPIKLLLKYFDQAGEVWKLKSDVTSMVTFKQFNLMTPFTALPQFDIVLCRNVLIYFNVETKRSVLEKIRSVMMPDGFLMLGGAETAFGITDKFVSDPQDHALFRTDVHAEKSNLTATA